MIHQGREVVERCASREELRLADHEVFAILVDVKRLPAICRIIFSGTIFVTVGTASDFSWFVLSTVLALFLPLFLALLFHDGFALSKVGNDLFPGGHGALHPRVLSDLLNTGTASWLERHHFLEQVFKLSRVDVLAIIFGLSVQCPKVSVIFRGEKLVVGIVGLG